MFELRVWVINGHKRANFMSRFSEIRPDLILKICITSQGKPQN